MSQPPNDIKKKKEKFILKIKFIDKINRISEVINNAFKLFMQKSIILETNTYRAN